MTPERCFVFDTNALVSALLFDQSIPALAFLAAADRGRILLSQQTLAELSEVLQRKKFDRYLDRVDREFFLAKLVHESRFVDVIEEILRLPRSERRQVLGIGGKRRRHVCRQRRSGFADAPSVSWRSRHDAGTVLGLGYKTNNERRIAERARNGMISAFPQDPPGRATVHLVNQVQLLGYPESRVVSPSKCPAVWESPVVRPELSRSQRLGDSKDTARNPGVWASVPDPRTGV